MPAKTVTLKQIWDKLVTMDQKLDRHDKQFEKIDQKLTAHDRQFAAAAKQSFALEDFLKKEIGLLTERVAVIEKGFEKLTADLELLTQEYHMITVALKRIETGIAEIRAGQDGLLEEVNALKRRMSKVENRVLALEKK